MVDLFGGGGRGGGDGDGNGDGGGVGSGGLGGDSEHCGYDPMSVVEYLLRPMHDSSTKHPGLILHLTPVVNELHAPSWEHPGNSLSVPLEHLSMHSPCDS